MKTTKNAIKAALLAAHSEEKGIIVRCPHLQGSHSYWTEVDNENNYVVKCYGSGQGWSDQTADLKNDTDIDHFVDVIYRDRKNISSLNGY